MPCCGLVRELLGLCATLAPFRAREFAPVIGGERGDEAEVARDLPCCKVLEEVGAECFRAAWGRQFDDCDDGLMALGAGGGNAEDQAIAHGGMQAESLFDGFGIDFASGDVDAL
jgi:hypothetical protein